MRKIELAKGVRTSILGFGCAPIMGSVDAAAGKRAIYAALDEGITHFDLARSYGYGEAEKFAGSLLRGKRNEIVLASKFGIVANWKANLISPVKPIVRYALGKIKKDKPLAVNSVGQPNTKIANKFLQRVPITPEEMGKSLHRSLKALRTDYLDCFFIHEPEQTLQNVEGLLKAAEKFKQDGKIRAIGLASMREQMSLHSAYINTFDILQFDNSPGAKGYNDAVVDRGQKANVIFSPLRDGSPHLNPSDKLKQLFTDFPNSVVLCSMFNVDHIKANAAIANLS